MLIRSGIGGLAIPVLPLLLWCFVRKFFVFVCSWVFRTAAVKRKSFIWESCICDHIPLVSTQSSGPQAKVGKYRPVNQELFLLHHNRLDRQSLCHCRQCTSLPVDLVLHFSLTFAPETLKLLHLRQDYVTTSQESQSVSALNMKHTRHQAPGTRQDM